MTSGDVALNLQAVAAAAEDTSWIRSSVYAVLFTGVAVALIVVGVRRRLARARWQREDDRRLLGPVESSASGDDRPTAALPGGGWLIAAGALLLMLGLGHILDVIATLHLNGTI